jgi:hypothetical protein
MCCGCIIAEDSECKADMEFESVQNSFHGTTFNLCAQYEHVPEIERYIRTVKDRSRSGYNSLPFEWIPRLVVVHLVGNSIFWLNAFPHEDGVSDTLSPQYLITGRHLPRLPETHTSWIRCLCTDTRATHQQHGATYMWGYMPWPNQKWTRWALFHVSRHWTTTHQKSMGRAWQDLHDDDKTCMQSSYWELILENGQ